MSPRIGTEVAHRDTPLKWNVFVIKRQGLTRDLPPGKEQWMWGPTSATLISGQRDAVLVDALLTVEQAHALSSSVAKGRWPRYTAGPRRRGKPKHSHRGLPVPGPGNVAAKRCASEKRAF